jgi:uncharacterized protein (TIRG00374 family)
MKILINFLKYAAAFGIAAFFIWWPLKGMTTQDKAEIRSALQQANYLWFLPLALLHFLNHLLRALRWKQFIEPLHYQPRGLVLYSAVLTGYFANAFLPRVGEVARCTVVTRYDKIPVEKLLGTIVAERALDTLCLGILAVLTLVVQQDVIGGYVSDIKNVLVHKLAVVEGMKWILLAAFVLLAVVVVYCIRRLRSGTDNLFNRLLKGLWQGLSSVVHIRQKGLFILYTILIWGGYIVATWMGCRMLAGTSGLGWGISLAMLVFGTFGIIVAPGGLGAYPYAIQTTLALYRVPAVIGLALGWLIWLSQFVFNMLGGLVALILLSFTEKYEKH